MNNTYNTQLEIINKNILINRLNKIHAGESAAFYNAGINWGSCIVRKITGGFTAGTLEKADLNINDFIILIQRSISGAKAGWEHLKTNFDYKGWGYGKMTTADFNEYRKQKDSAGDWYIIENTARKAAKKEKYINLEFVRFQFIKDTYKTQNSKTGESEYWGGLYCDFLHKYYNYNYYDAWGSCEQKYKSDAIDKSGYFIEGRRADLKRRAAELKASREKAAADSAADLKKSFIYQINGALYDAIKETQHKAAATAVNRYYKNDAEFLSAKYKDIAKQAEGVNKFIFKCNNNKYESIAAIEKAFWELYDSITDSRADIKKDILKNILCDRIKQAAKADGCYCYYVSLYDAEKEGRLIETADRITLIYNDSFYNSKNELIEKQYKETIKKDEKIFSWEV